MTLTWGISNSSLQNYFENKIPFLPGHIYFFAKALTTKTMTMTKVIIEKSRGERSLIEQDTIENVS